MEGAGPIQADVWVHPDVVVRASPIAGRGLFAAAPIAADVIVVRLGGHVVTTRELHDLFARAADDVYIDTFAIGDDAHLVLPRGTAAHFGNHSCAPTLWPVGALELATRMHVDVGEELTVDYGLISDDPTFRMTCACGVDACRGIVTGADWRNPELQLRYAGHWPPGLQRRIDRRRVSRPTSP